MSAEKLIKYLLNENPKYSKVRIPTSENEQFRIYRSLVNVRPADEISAEYLAAEDEYLRQKTAEKGITDIADLSPVEDDIYLWRGDITTLKCGAIVNAANSAMLGCFVPCHKCIDNAIHTYSGVQLRAECARIMEGQGHEEKTGTAKHTHAYNLPCKYILHTVGPVVQGRVTKRDRELLASCYRSCLQLAEEKKLESVVFNVFKDEDNDIYRRILTN